VTRQTVTAVARLEAAPGQEDFVASNRRSMAEAYVEPTWTPLGTAFPANGVTAFEMQKFLARGVTAGQAEPEETERLELRQIRLRDALQLIDRGEITDGPSIIGLYCARHRLHGWAVDR
jgi:hypothetical protein